MADGPVAEVLLRRLEAAYQSVTGQPLPGDQLARSAAMIRQIAEGTGLKPFASALGQLLRYPHRISARQSSARATPYAWIAVYGTQQLTPYIWRAGQPPWRQAAPRQGM